MASKNFNSSQKKEGRKQRLLSQYLFNSHKFLFLFLIFHLSVNVSSDVTSQITLTIKQSGEQRLIDNRFYSKISQVLVNRGTTSCKDTCNLSGSEKYQVVLKLSNGITNSNEMFKDRSNIIEVDLSNFDASQVTEMNSMFRSCQNLEKVTFGTMGSNLVYTMERLFQDCSRLTSVDLNNLDIFDLLYKPKETDKFEPLTFLEFYKYYFTNLQSYFNDILWLNLLNIKNR